MQILHLQLKQQQDVLAVRQQARRLAAWVGLCGDDPIKLATAVSEVARTLFGPAQRPTEVSFRLEGQAAPQSLVARVNPVGSLEVLPVSQAACDGAASLGSLGVRRLVDDYRITTDPGCGTIVDLKKTLPPTAALLTPQQLGQWGGAWRALQPEPGLDELQRHNGELLQVFDELQRCRHELATLTSELQDTNRGVVALYAELDEQAQHLRDVDEMKTRFLSNMSHEFRTPLSSIRALTGLLLARADGALNAEQEIQVGYIRKAADELAELVNDWLDLAKIESGKAAVTAQCFDLRDTFSALRGMLRPLLRSPQVDLVFELPDDVPLMHTDEGKVSQILRNLISNALKFTDRGQVRVRAQWRADEASVAISVEDSGVGMAAEHLDLIFEEFSQLENRLQTGVKGTGLGLPLCKKLAGLLGGQLQVRSTLGQGSTFTVTLPLRLPLEPASERSSLTSGHHPLMPQRPLLAPEHVALTPPHPAITPTTPTTPAVGGRPVVLVVAHDAQTRALYEQYLRHSRYQSVTVSHLADAQAALQDRRPCALLLDGVGCTDGLWPWRAHGVAAPNDREPVTVIVAGDSQDRHAGSAPAADAYLLKPLSPETLLSTLDELCAAGVCTPT